MDVLCCMMCSVHCVLIFIIHYRYIQLSPPETTATLQSRLNGPKLPLTPASTNTWRAHNLFNKTCQQLASPTLTHLQHPYGTRIRTQPHTQLSPSEPTATLRSWLNGPKLPLTPASTNTWRAHTFLTNTCQQLASHNNLLLPRPHTSSTHTEHAFEHNRTHSSALLDQQQPYTAG